MVRQIARVRPRSRRFTLRLDWLEAREVPSIALAEEVVDAPEKSDDIPGILEQLEEMPVDVNMNIEDRIRTTSVVPGSPRIVTQPRDRFVIASRSDREAIINVYDSQTNALIGTITPFGRGVSVSPRVAVGDVNGDGVSDIIVGAGEGSAPIVKVFDGQRLVEIESFLAYAETFTGGMYVAAGDIDGDGLADIVTGAGENGGPHINVFSGKDLFPTGEVRLTVEPYARQSFFAYESDFRGGVSVAVGDTNGDGFADIITGAGPGGGPRVRVISGKDETTLANYFAYSESIRSGIMVSVGNLNESARSEIVTVLMNGTSPDVKVFQDDRLLTTYQPFGSEESGNGVAVQDLNQDGFGDIIVTSAPGRRQRVIVLDGLNGHRLRDFPALMPEFQYGLFVA
ncbi:MAG: FG-GAP and VCBS repeat-containing protein [Fimbriiglobus sp.]